MKKYRPINCNYYDEITLLILRKQKSNIQFYDEKGKEQSIIALITDVYTREGAEYLQLKEGQEIRLDQLIALDDKVRPQ